MSTNPRFTVFTPCYNSDTFIDRVFASLEKQTFRDFEWYVINDASTDNTHERITNYSKEVDFPVIYHNLKKNQGLHTNLNQGIRDAKGDFFIFYGHDDEISPDALAEFDRLLKKYDSDEISAVYGLAKDQNGKLVGKKYPENEFVSDYWTQFFTLENEAEKFQCFRTKYLREFYPLNTDPGQGVSSGWLWGKLGGKYKAIFVNQVFRIYYTNVKTSLTATTKRNSDPVKVFNYYEYWVNEFQYHIHGNWKRRLKGIGGYVSYGLLAEKTLREILTPIKSLANKIIVLSMYPVAAYYNSVKKG